MDFAPHTEAEARARAALSGHSCTADVPSTGAPKPGQQQAASSQTSAQPVKGVRVRLPAFYVLQGPTKIQTLN